MSETSGPGRFLSRSGRRSRAFSSCVWFTWLLCVGSASVGCGHKPVQLEPRQAMRDLWLPAVGTVPLPSRGLQGNVVLVTFTATWCFPCVADLPTFQALQKRHAEEGLVVIGVGMDLEGAKVLDPFARFHELSFPLVVAGERIRRGESVFGHITALPATFLIGRDGKVLAAYQGVAAPKELGKLIHDALRR